ncbi:hypothetical protein FQV39_30430 (plasmid) [Bosea sp. F3-2]|uniref:hypothetical protein n=1 Tax=Bosea sp. F3-2 TaxID=2599640 RepID=UPI0011ED4B40|nr:hypothetical protein [Bosea sp. F3-2]QEL26969.1 hypothetical protein FQV39_30430 [Bosea sp. F3-2]
MPPAHSKNPRIDVVDIKQMVVAGEPGGPAVLTCRGVGGRLIDLHLSPEAMTKLEAFLARANLEQAKLHQMH